MEWKHAPFRIDPAVNAAKDRLQNYLVFCFQNAQSFKGFWKQFRAGYFVTIPNRFFSGSFIYSSFGAAAGLAFDFCLIRFRDALNFRQGSS